MAATRIKNNPDQVMVVQDGARLHYAIPLAFQHADVLDRIFASWYSNPGSLSWLLAKTIRLFNSSLGQKMLDRYAPGLDSSKMVQFRSLAWTERRNRRLIKSDRAFYALASEQFARRIRTHGWGDANAIFGFIRNIHPDLCHAARQAGLLTIADQMIAPYEIELAEELLQRQRFPNWSESPLPDAAESWTPFERTTWDQLDHISCASPYVRDGLIQQGIQPNRISVLPYPIEASQFPQNDRCRRAGPLVVGFVGAVGLRKGAPYFVEVARRMNSKAIRFVMIGSVHLSPSVLPDVRRYVEIIGPVPRSEVRDWLQKFDLYFFPSTCEGSAGSIMEAMASGLPVVTSPNAGSIIEHGRSGFIHPYSDIDSLAASVAQLASHSDLRLQMGRASRLAAEACSIQSYSLQWKTLLSKLSLRSPDRAKSSQPHP